MKNEPLEANITEPSVIFRISRTYKPEMNAKELYDITRGYWKMNLKQAEKARFAVAAAKGVVVEVYEIEQWLEGGSTESTFDEATLVKGRYEFVGKRASEEIRQKYIDKSIKHYFTRANVSPFTYINLPK